MLFHLVPKLYSPYANISNVEILSISIPDLNIKINQSELSQGKPFPNKNYYVGMLKGRKAMNGILLELGDIDLKTFTVLIEWSLKVNDKNTHKFEHKIINHIEGSNSDNGLITHDATLWYADKNFESKWGNIHSGQAPVEFQPKLDLTNIDEVAELGLTCQESEITLPILEADRLSKHVAVTSRTPTQVWVKPN